MMPRGTFLAKSTNGAAGDGSLARPKGDQQMNLGTFTFVVGKLLHLYRANFYTSAGQPKICVFCGTVIKKLNIISSRMASFLVNLLVHSLHCEWHDVIL